MSASISAELQDKLDQTIHVLNVAKADYPNLVLANSLGAEDVVLTDLISKYAPGIQMFCLDTGRLPEETLKLLAEIEKKYNTHIDIYYPEAQPLQQFVKTHGINAFYESAEFRKACCQVRKLEPLARALQGKDAWITGLRKEQSVTRSDVTFVEWDAGNDLYKVNPLIEWTEKEVWDYIRAYKVPYNALHDQHYPSIGCAPCTRAISAGEDVRAGRWWWENPESKECGLHPVSQLNQSAT